MPTLSGYRMMWMLVLFDLPVGTRGERKRATAFRNLLLDLGCEMVQFSAYARFCASKEQSDAYSRQIERQLPQSGKVTILYFTDKQYENAVTFTGRTRQPSSQKPDQLALF